MRTIGEWVCCDEHLYNRRTHELVKIPPELCCGINKMFLETETFRQLRCSAPQVVVQQPPVHQILALEITDQCNYGCGYCFEGLSSRNTRVLDFERACRAIDKLPPKSELRFFGGEPLLHFPLVRRLIERYPQHSYSLVTNGSVLTNEIALFLAEHHVAVGLSYDGARWQENNRPAITGNSRTDFERAIKIFSAVGLDVGVSTVVTKHSIADLYDIHLEVFADYPCVSGWAYLVAYQPNMDLGDLDVLRQQIFAIVDDFPAKHLMRINDLRKWAMKISGEWPVDGYCGAGICYSALAVDGAERLCTFFLREGLCYTPALRSVEVKCKRCPIWAHCKGGCLALNRFGSGDTHRSHPFACKKNMIYFEAGLKTRIKVSQEISLGG